MVIVIIFMLFLGASTQAAKASNEPPKNAGLPAILPINNHAKVKLPFGGNPVEEGLQKNGKSFVKDLLQELDGEAKQIVDKKIFNETRGIEMCLNIILYVNESLGGVLTISREVHMVLHFPVDDNEAKGKSAHKEYKSYGVQVEGRMVPKDFEVLEKHPKYTISKHENVTCERGTFLAKTYYEWPEADRKKIVLKLSNQYPPLDNEKVHDFPAPHTDDSDDHDVLGRSSNDDFSFSEEDLDYETPPTISENGQQALGMPKGSSDIFMSAESPLIMGPTPNYIKGQFRNRNIGDLLGIGYTSELPLATENTTKTTPQGDKMIPSMDSCSPFLTQLLSGSGILPGLCNLKRDEKVVLRGDIIISKKYFNEGNQTEVVQPMYVIHENTEIEAIMNETGTIVKH